MRGHQLSEGTLPPGSEISRANIGFIARDNTRLTLISKVCSRMLPSCQSSFLHAKGKILDIADL